MILNMSWGYFPSIFDFIIVGFLTLLIEIPIVYYWLKEAKEVHMIDVVFAMVMCNVVSGLMGIFFLTMLNVI